MYRLSPTTGHWDMQGKFITRVAAAMIFVLASAFGTVRAAGPVSGGSPDPSVAIAWSSEGGLLVGCGRR